ncbi:MAG TPA: hypothetical protein VE990_09520 [Acidimicrobiales bacterium]|nr:hypothetical protein [Acidimicrobiales bacterium]
MDLLGAAFVVLAEGLFERTDAGVKPRPLEPLPPKGNVQDDPFDVRVAELLSERLSDVRHRPSIVKRAPGPLISPDMVLTDTEAGLQGLEHARTNGPPPDPVAWATGLEVKKVEFKAGKPVGRSSGPDYNSTPPTPVALISADGVAGPLPVPATYLFATLDITTDHPSVPEMVMCVGSVLDSSDKEYKWATSPRTKRINLGSYGDGMDRVRPMYVYPNPLSVPDFRNRATLIHDREDLTKEYPQLHRMGALTRTLAEPNKGSINFSYYRLASDVSPEDSVDLPDDPFKKVLKRSERTAPRGKFVLNLP